MPFRIIRGRVQFASEVPLVLEGELEQMTMTLRCLDDAMSRTSGATLIDHFYADAFAGLSSRMRRLASELGFYASV
jgi:hypothetical protein